MLETSASQSQSQYGKETDASSFEVTTIICPICDAVYAPSHVHSSFLLSSSEALESAFMSMCHFCFRCRRPACPQCWDGVHGVCGDCVRQAHLLFRTEAAPLDGVRFSPLRKQEKTREEVASALLICMRPGRFQQTTMHADGMAVGAIKTAEKKPTNLSEDGVMGQMEQMGQMGSAGQTVKEPQLGTGSAAVTATAEAREGGSDAADKETAQHLWHWFRVLGRVLTILALVVLLAIIVLVALSEFSDTANTLIIQVLHIDIRTEIAYLVHLVQQLH